MHLIVVIFVSLFVISCGLANDDSDGCTADEECSSGEVCRDGACEALPTRNDCGGMETLDDTPGAPCGECMDGVFVCSGVDSLRCIADTPKNACGGCEPLDHAPGDACGPCDDGNWECGSGPDDGKLVCSGASKLNACGGCGEISGGQPGFVCDVGGQSGTYACANSGAVMCVGPDRNGCGGTTELAGVPGTACGRCGGGYWACDGQEEVVCQGPDVGVNECGGCDSLIGQRGAPCGACDGILICDGVDALRCSKRRNLCGGCQQLDHAPAEPCNGVDHYICLGPNTISCRNTGITACGGELALSAMPGTTCGTCDEGRYVCDGTDVECAAALENPCGGCTILEHLPGESCPGGTWACDGAEAVICQP